MLPSTSIWEKSYKMSAIDKCRLLQLELEGAHLLQFYRLTRAEKSMKRDKLRLISKEIGCVRMEQVKLLKRLKHRQNSYMVAISKSQKVKRLDVVTMEQRAAEEKAMEERNSRPWSLILPEEVCIKLFEYLDNPKDLKNLASSSPLFEEYLSARRPSYLFPDVAKVLVQCKFVSEAIEVLKLRLVNTYTKKGVDDALEMIPEYFKRFPDRDYVATLKAAQQQGHLQGFERRERSLVFRLYNHRLDRVHQIIHQLHSSGTRYTGTGQSPFPSRHLFLQERPHHRTPIAMEHIFQRQKMTRDFLDAAGRHIWYCDMCTHSYGMLTLTTWYLGIVEFLRRMPNLKALLLHYPLAGRGYNKRDLCQLGEVMHVHPFPVMDKLEMLYIKDIPDSMTSVVLKSNSQCPAVQLGSSISLMGKSRFLESLSFLVTSPIELISCCRTRRWQSLSQLEMDFSLQGSSVSWQNTFSFLERYQDTLTHLQVSLPWGASAPTGHLAVLNLPKVTELRLTLRIFTGIDFILGLSSLKKLHINVTYAHYKIKASYGRPMQYDERIQFNKYYHRLLESNIWQLIPTLQEAKITVLMVDNGSLNMDHHRFVTYKYSRSQLEAVEANEEEKENGAVEASAPPELVAAIPPPPPLPPKTETKKTGTMVLASPE